MNGPDSITSATIIFLPSNYSDSETSASGENLDFEIWPKYVYFEVSAGLTGRTGRTKNDPDATGDPYSSS